MRRDAQGVLLLALAAALVKVGFSGAARYVRPGMVVPLLLAAVVLAALGATALWPSLRSRLAGGAAPDGPLVAGWLLLVPVLAALVVAPPALGRYHADRYGTQLAQHAPAQFGPLPAGDPVPLTLVEYAARAIVEQGRSLSGRRVRLLGFIVTAADSQPYLARLAQGCCAADARPIKVGLTGEVPDGLTAGEWVAVEGGYTGRVERDPHGGDLIPYLEVASVRPVPEPAQPYES